MEAGIEARLMVIGGQGVMPVEGVKRAENFGASISRIPLFRDGSQITRRENRGYWCWLQLNTCFGR